MFLKTSSQHSDNFGDIIKFTLSKFREASPNHWYQPILLALQQEFERVRDLNSGVIDHTSAEWADTKVDRCIHLFHHHYSP